MPGVILFKTRGECSDLKSDLLSDTCLYICYQIMLNSPMVQKFTSGSR